MFKEWGRKNTYNNQYHQFPYLKQWRMWPFFSCIKTLKKVLLKESWLKMLPLISCISILRESTKDIQLVSLSIMKDDQLLRTHHLQVHLHIDFHMQIKFCVTFQVLTSWQLSDLKGTTSESTNSFLKSVAFHQNLLE